jgi:transposase
MSDKLNTAIAVIGIDIGKNSFHVVGHDKRGATIMLRQKWSRGQLQARLANLSPCLIGMEAASARIISVASCRRLATTPG